MAYNKEIEAQHGSSMSRGGSGTAITLVGRATGGPKDTIGRRVEYRVEPDDIARMFTFASETAAHMMLPTLIKALQERSMGKPKNPELRRLLTEALAAAES